MTSSQEAMVLRYRICETEVAVTLHDPTLREPTRRLFRPYEISGSPVLGAATTVRTRMVDEAIGVEWGQGRRERAGSFEDFIIALEFALTESLLSACGDYAHLHASGAVVGDRAVLALGTAGAGKSSLALSWSLRGIPTLGDDVVFIDADARVVPFKRLFKVTSTVLEEGGLSPEGTPFWSSGSEEAWYDPREGGGWALTAPVEILAFVRYEPRRNPTVRAIDRTSALCGLLQHLLPGGLRLMDAFDRLVALTRGARAFDVVYGSSAGAAHILAEMAR